LELASELTWPLDFLFARARRQLPQRTEAGYRILENIKSYGMGGKEVSKLLKAKGLVLELSSCDLAGLYETGRRLLNWINQRLRGERFCKIGRAAGLQRSGARRIAVIARYEYYRQRNAVRG
jgi:hypothetical protein